MSARAWRQDSGRSWIHRFSLSLALSHWERESVVTEDRAHSVGFETRPHRMAGDKSPRYEEALTPLRIVTVLGVPGVSYELVDLDLLASKVAGDVGSEH